MTPIPAAPVRRHHLRTGLLLAAAAGAAVAAALLAPRGPRPVEPPRGERPPARTASSLTVGLPGRFIAAGPAETYLVASITAPDATGGHRAAASVAIVIDRSGSMGDDGKLGQAKEAARALVERLAPDDEATLISYSDQATVEVPLVAADAAGKAALTAAIDRLVPHGDTAISAALWAGADELSRAHRDVRRVVLLSDGKPTSGIRDAAELIRFAGTRAETGISISAVGMGVEYNEQIMAGIASAGRGNYYFVEHGTRLAELFVKELDSLGQTVIASGDLLIDVAPGVRVVDVLGYAYDRPSPTTVRVPVADLRAGQHTKVVLRLATELTATTAGYRAGQVDVASVRWRFRRVGGGTGDEIADARAIVSADPADLERGRDAAVARMIEEARTAEALDQAAGAYDRGDLEQAQQILRVRATEARATAAAIGDQDLERTVRRYTDSASAGFAAPPPSAAARAGGVKARRADAYDLAR